VQFSAKGQDITNEAALELMRLNISKDKTYFAQPKRRNASRLSRSIHHSKFAVRLATIPLQPTHEQLAQWHRPRGLWWPLRPVKAPVARHGVSVALCTLTHHVDRKFLDVSSSEVQLSQLWDEVWMKRKLLRQDVEEVKDLVKPLFVVPGKPAQIVNGDVALIHSGAIKKDTARLGIVVAYRDAVLMPTAKAENVPDEANAALLRPPLAFGRKEELAASAPGKVLLLEYMEEAPALLNRPGMGARLTTYYRQSNAADAGHWRMRDAAISGGRLWRVGAVVPLGSEDESPFLGELKPGTGQLSVETGLFTAPAHSYNSLPSDFLLTRSSAGVMRVREITGAITSGQQLPLHRIPPPGARDLKDLLERRMYVYVFQTLRTDQSNLDKNPGNQAVAVVSLKEMHRLFPSRPLNMIRLYLKNECGLEYMGKRHGSDDELFGLKPGARLPSEAEIKKKVGCILECFMHRAMR